MPFLFSGMKGCLSYRVVDDEDDNYFGQVDIFVQHLDVVHEHRNQGVASGLLQRLIDENPGKTIGLNAVSADLKPQALCRLYERHGFKFWGASECFMVRENSHV